MTVSAWDRLPEDLRTLGYRRDPRHLFGRLQRVDTWTPDGPDLARPGRELVDAHLDLALPSIVDERVSGDGSRRLVLAFGDGARVEAVHMPRAVVRPRVTVCLSSQVGCAMGCTFCATARMGLVRNLAAHEIIGQLLAVLEAHGPRSAKQLNLVFMGMGEPLHNTDNVLRALDVLCDERGLGVAPSRITVSTSGHVPGLAKLAQSAHRPELAVSVNGADDAVRTRLMPINKRWPLEDLRAALGRWPLRPHQKITLEYVLLEGTNDSLESADRLAAWAAGLRHTINVIPFNAWEDDETPHGHREPSAERLTAFVARLRERGSFVTVRRSRGRDVRAACGTLAVG